MPWTDAEREALRSAIARGVQTVVLAGESVTFQKLSDMRELLAEMDRQLGLASGAAQSYRLAATSKGV